MLFRSEEIAAGLESAQLTKGRLEVRKAAGLTFLDDSYNANLDSMRAALETLAGFACTGRRIAVLGRMAELGEHSPQQHRDVGAAACGVDELCIVGGGDAPLIGEGFLAAGGRRAAVYPFPDQAACAAHLRAAAAPADLILVKGSRSAAMEKVIELLTA